MILTNKAKSFQSTSVMETGLSNFHRMTISILKKHFRKLPPKVIGCRDFKNFENEKFMNSLQSAIINQMATVLKILTYFSTSVMRYLTSMPQERKTTYARIIYLS